MRGHNLPRFISTNFVSGILVSTLGISVIICGWTADGTAQSTAQNATTEKQLVTAASKSTNSAPSPEKEGRRLGKYNGIVPLSDLENYFQGEEDLRGGMTCTFRIDPDLAPFTFRFEGREDNSLGDLDVIESDTGDVVQTIENTIDPSGIPMGTAAQSVLTTVDANFDSYRDLQVLSNCGATGNCAYDFYLCNPKKEEFIRNDFLSNLATPTFDGAKKQLTSSSNGSASDWENDTYQYEDGDYTLIRREVSEWDRKTNSVTVSTYELENGKMALVDSSSGPQ